MKWYVRHHLQLKETNGMFFTPGKASYVTSTSSGVSENFCEGLDALYIDPHPTGYPKSKKFVEVKLNGSARVFLLLITTKTNLIRQEDLKSVKGLDPIWKEMRAIKTVSESPIRIGSKSRDTEYFLPSHAIAVEAVFSEDKIITLPDPRSITINGDKEVGQYCLLFAQMDIKSNFPIPFQYPTAPSSILNLLNSKTIIAKAPLPNEQCPTWLHDSYITETRDSVVAGKEGEPKFWRTWHPIVDPIYWCYFDHEHGSYPGHYQPMFGYTAWKTLDEDEITRRQMETHRGFKVFAIPLPSQKKFVIMTLHMHTSLPRRFYARHHTMIFASLGENWEIEVELHMKMDFGFAAASLMNGDFIPLSEDEERIKMEVGLHRLRRFNILDLTNYPSSIDKKFATRSHLKPTMSNEYIISKGVYEQWRGALNTCSSSARNVQVPFSFDFREVSTAKRKFGDGVKAPLQRLKGTSIDRKIQIPTHNGNMIIGPQLCEFEGKEKPNGVFYTDSYLSKVLPTHGLHSVRQFFKPGFKSVYIKPGKLSPSGPWGVHYEYQNDIIERRHTQIEEAVVVMLN